MCAALLAALVVVGALMLPSAPGASAAPAQAAVPAAKPGLTYFAKLAQEQGRCMAFGYDLTNRQIRPTTSRCYA